MASDAPAGPGQGPVVVPSPPSAPPPKHGCVGYFKLEGWWYAIKKDMPSDHEDRLDQLHNEVRRMYEDCHRRVRRRVQEEFAKAPENQQLELKYQKQISSNTSS